LFSRSMISTGVFFSAAKPYHALASLDAPKFSGRGGIVRARALFGARLPGLLDELTDTLVA
jgi:hypothetical protein